MRGMLKKTENIAMRLTIRYSMVLAFTLVTAFSVPAEAQSSLMTPLILY